MYMIHAHLTASLDECARGLRIRASTVGPDYKHYYLDRAKQLETWHWIIGKGYAVDTAYVEACLREVRERVQADSTNHCRGASAVKETRAG